MRRKGAPSTSLDDAVLHHEDRAGAEGRIRILDEAERLMADHGVLAVSLREINGAAGQRNASALQYHFGGREGLLRAILEIHEARINARRNQRIDALEAAGQSADIFALVRALVEPVAEELESLSGRRFLRILLQVHWIQAAQGAELSVVETKPSIVRVVRHLAPLAPGLPPAIFTERTGQSLMLVVQALADQACRIDEPRRRPPLPAALFACNLVDVLVGVIRAPVSAETSALVSPPAR